MKLLVLLSILIMSFPCIAASKNIASEISSIDMDVSGNEVSKENIKVYLNNEGKPKASMRFEVSYSSAPKNIHNLYIWGENVPALKDRLLRISEGALTPREIFKVVKFGRDEGMVNPIEKNEKKYVQIQTVTGAFLFHVEDIPKLISLLETLEKAYVPKK
jgi:hypothetical protein